MQMPPSNMTPSELFAAITQKPRAHRFVDFPRVGDDGAPLCRLAMWVLTPTERAAATSAAEKFARSFIGAAKDGEKSIGYDTLFEVGASTEILARACRDPYDLTKPFFPSAEVIRDHLTTEEVAVLFEGYLQIQSELGPIVSIMSKVEMDAWVDRLSGGATGISPFYAWSRPAMAHFIIYLANQLSKVRMANSSSGTPSENLPNPEA